MAGRWGLNGGREKLNGGGWSRVVRRGDGLRASTRVLRVNFDVRRVKFGGFRSRSKRILEKFKKRRSDLYIYFNFDLFFQFSIR